MSDYFGALMRSSGLRVGSTQPVPRQHEAPVSGRADTADIAEISVEREVEGAGRAEPARLQRSPEWQATERDTAAHGDPFRSQPPSTARHSDSLDRRAQLDAEWLQRAALDAAMRWVASDPLASRSGPAPEVRAPQSAANPAPRSTEGRSAPPEIAEPPSAPSSSNATFTRAGDDLSIAEIDFESSSPLQTQAALPAAERQTAHAPIEEIVEVSIGAIHVHVDSPKTAAAKPASTPWHTSEGRERSPRSGLDRRYLRAI